MKAAVVGASGYLGAELMRLLSNHPVLEVAAAQAASSAGRPFAEIYPGIGPSYKDLVLSSYDPSALRGCDVVFVAVPSGHSQQIVRDLIDEVGVVVDLGADFRLKDPSLYDTWYGWTHQAPELLDRAVYGLPELNRAHLVGASLIAAPGCYVTAASLALAPFVREGLIGDRGIIIDAASGTSGAGRSFAADTHFATVNENFSAYKVLNHRHTPEIEQTIGAEVLFTPHLAPMTRGILATCYGISSKEGSTESLLSVLGRAYEGEPFVEVTSELPQTRETYGANSCRVTARFDERTGHVVVLSAIDNLTKGGAGQALQAANIALGLSESMGLSRIGLMP